MWRMFQGVRDLRQESQSQVWVSAANGGQKKQAICTSGRTGGRDVLPPGLCLSHRLDCMSESATSGVCDEEVMV